MTTYELVALDDSGREQGRCPIATLPFKPGDVLVVQVDGAAPLADVERLREVLGAVFPLDRVLIVHESVRFLRLEATDA